MLLHQDQYCEVSLDAAQSLLEVKWLTNPGNENFIKYFFSNTETARA